MEKESNIEFAVTKCNLAKVANTKENQHVRNPKSENICKSSSRVKLKKIQSCDFS